ncbi:peptide deformylase [Nonomuraea sp. NPDC049709]
MQHETDHLDGVLFLDRVDAQRRGVEAIRSAGWHDEATPPQIKVSLH